MIKFDPWPTFDSTWIAPAIPTTNDFVIARPNSVPPMARELVESTCVNQSKIRLRFISEIPMPYLVTLIST